MRKKIIYCLLMIIFFILVFKVGSVDAAQNVNIRSNVTNVKKDEEFEISINIENMTIAALQLELYFDSNSVEFISEPENVNLINNTILYTWFDETGGDNPKQTGAIVSFRFKAKRNGEAIFGANGRFFDKNENEIVTKINGVSVYVTEESNDDINAANNENVGDSNSYLQIMRLGIEGITPDFNKDITEYYAIVNPTVLNLDIIAIPENSGAVVNIGGDTILRNGLNKIVIEVISKDGTAKRVYTINITRTAEPNKANANLETLAIEYFRLEPEFAANVTHYKVKVTNDTNKVNIFAVPENYLAKANIKNIDSLQFGDNTIVVTVTAENGITTKDYVINVYRKTAEEDEKEKEEQEANEIRLTAILKEQEELRVSNIEKQEDNNRYIKILPEIVLLIILTLLIIYKIASKKMKIINSKK